MATIEIIARVIRDLLNEQLRKISETDDKAFHEATCKFLNTIFKDEVLQNPTLEEIQKRFPFTDSVQSQFITSSDLFHRVQQLCGIKFKESALSQKVFDVTDILVTEPVTCHLHVVYFYEGFVAHHAALQTKDIKKLDEAINKYMEAWLRKPDDVKPLMNWSMALKYKAELCSNTAEKKRYLDAAIAKYDLINRESSRDTEMRYNYAVLMHDYAFIQLTTSLIIQYLDRAISIFYDVVERDRNHWEAYYSISQLCLEKAKLDDRNAASLLVKAKSYLQRGKFTHYQYAYALPDHRYEELHRAITSGLRYISQNPEHIKTLSVPMDPRANRRLKASCSLI